MATPYYQPDPYRGWRVVGGGNYCAQQIMCDTSGRWQCVFWSPFYRRYAEFQ